MKRIIGYIVIIALACSLVLGAGVTTAFAEGSVSFTADLESNQLPAAGGTVTAVIEVNNNYSGNITLTGLTCNGSAVSIDQNASVAPGSSYQAERNITVPAFASGETAKALNYILSYTDPNGAAQTATTATQVTKTSVEKVTGVASVDDKTLKKGDKATFTFTFKNEGDVKIENATLKAPPINGGEVIGQAFSLNAGDSKTMTYAITVNETIDVKPTLTFTAGGSNKSLLLDTIEVEVEKAAVSSGMSLALTADTESVEAGAAAVITAVVTNTGNDTLTDVALLDSEGNAVSTDTALDAGESTTATVTVNPTETKSYEFSVTAKNSEDKAVDAKSNKLNITVGAAASASSAASASAESSGGQNLSIEVVADTNVLEAPGEVTFQITVANNSDVLLSNVKVTESSLGEIGTISAMGKETKTFEKTVQVDKTSEYNFVVTATLEDGSSIEAQLDSPFTVTVNGSSSSLSFLVIIMIIIVIAIIGVGVTLFILYRKNKKAGITGGVFGAKTQSSVKSAYGSNRRPSAFNGNGNRSAQTQSTRTTKSSSFEVEPKKQVRKPVTPTTSSVKKGNTKFGDRNKF